MICNSRNTVKKSLKRFKYSTLFPGDLIMNSKEQICVTVDKGIKEDLAKYPLTVSKLVNLLLKKYLATHSPLEEEI